jgi:heptosyltransferase-2
MHLAISMRTPVVALFGPTCGQEVEMYGRGRKITSPKPCGPCYRRECRETPTCMDEIGDESILAAVRDVLSMEGRV